MRWAAVVASRAREATSPTRTRPPARPYHAPTSSIRPHTPTTVAGYAEGATSTPARSTMPSRPTPSAASAIVNQNRIGPRRRGFRGGGAYAGGGGGAQVGAG